MQHSSDTGIDEYTAKGILRAYGIPTAREALVHDLDEAKARVMEIGYPVVLKVCSAELMHKTELGLIRLNLKDEHELIQAYEELRMKDSRSPLLMAEMLRGDRELMAGIVRHQGFPPCLVFGLGGVFAEAIDDISLRLSPVTRNDVFEMLNGISSNTILNTYRSMEPVDREAVADIIIALDHLVTHFPRIKEMDLNPIIVKNGKPFVADALMIIEKE